MLYSLLLKNGTRIVINTTNIILQRVLYVSFIYMDCIISIVVQTSRSSFVVVVVIALLLLL